MSKDKTITITIKGGCVIEVTGLPDDCKLKIVDLDINETECYAGDEDNS